VRNAGGRDVVLGGNGTAVAGIEVDGEPVNALVRVGWLEPSSRSWFSALPAVAHRFGIVKASWAGAWTFWLVVVLVLAVAGLVARILLGPDDEPRTA
jgi:hypothetical protein